MDRESLISSSKTRERREGVREFINAHPDIRLERLTPLLYDTDQDVSFLSALALKDIKDPRIFEFIQRNEFGKMYRSMLAATLLEDVSYPEFFEIRYRPQHEMHRALHIANLGKQYRADKVHPILASLEEALKDPSPAIRETAAGSLAKMNTITSVNMLDNHLKEETDDETSLYILQKLSEISSFDMTTYKIPEDKKDQIIACLYGVLIGDALGAPTEFMDRGHIIQVFGKIQEFKPDTGRDLAPGQYTDDGEMTLFTLAHLVNKGFSNQGLAETLAEKVRKVETREIQWRGYGGTTRMALRDIGAGLNYRFNNKDKKKSCGAAMRILPIAIANYQESEEDFKQEVIKASRITHTSNESVAGALAIAYVARKILDGEPVGETIFDEINEFTADMPSYLHERLNLAKAQYGKFTEHGVDVLDDTDTRTGVTVPLAIYIFAKEQDDFKEAVIYGANTAGDSDSIASMAGGLAGLKGGMSTIPPKFLSKVDDQYLKEILDKQK